MSRTSCLVGQTTVDEEQALGEDSDVEPAGHSEVRALMRGTTLAVIAGSLAKAYPDVESHVDDAIIEAIVKFLAKRAKGVVIENPAGYVRVTAKNFLLNKLEREVRRETTDEGHASLEAVDLQPHLEDRETFEFLRGIIERWESGRMRVVTLLYLEAGYEGDVLSQAEAASLAGEILGEEVPWTSIGKTRERGLKKLRDEILAIAGDSGFDPITGKENE